MSTISPRATIALFARLRWKLLRGALRHGGAQRIAVIAGTVVAITAGLITGVGIAVVARLADEPNPFLVVATALTVLAIVAVGIIAGVAQPVDPRILAAEPLGRGRLALGLLTTSAAGPPGIAAVLVGIGFLVGSLRGVTSIAPAVVATGALLFTLLLVSRTTVNALGLFSTRFPRLGQVLVGVVSLVFYGAFQFVPSAFADLSAADRQRVADVVQFTPPGQLGRAFATADESVGQSLLHSALGALWLPLLAWVFVGSTRRLLVSTKHDISGNVAGHDAGPIRRAARRACGGGQQGAIAWRSVLTRMRHPRTALETFVGAGVGMSVVLVPALTRDAAGASAVLVGGAVQLAVLFMAGNAIGSDGPALGSELLCGLEPETVLRAKGRSILVVASPLVVIGPLVAAAITGEWAYLPAGFLVAGGGLMSGVGGSLVQSTYVPIAVPESDNPLASGDTGNGLLAAGVLVIVVLSLAVLTTPIALALLWALDRGSVLLVSLFAAITLGAGWLVMRAGLRIAGRRWRSHEPEIFTAIVPAR